MTISVILPVFNGEAFIERALKSVFTQNVPEEILEVIVINDGSTDRTQEILSEMENELVVINQQNQGLVPSCNKGLKESTGDFVIRLDADDCFSPDLLSETVEFLNLNPEYDYVYTDRFEVDERSNKTSECKVGQDNIFNMVACGVLIRRAVFGKIGFYDHLLFEEYDFFIRLFKHFKGYYLPKSLYYYFKHGLNMTEQEDYWENGFKELINKWGEEEVNKWVEVQVRETGESRFSALLNGGLQGR